MRDFPGSGTMMETVRFLIQAPISPTGRAFAPRLHTSGAGLLLPILFSLGRAARLSGRPLLLGNLRTSIRVDKERKRIGRFPPDPMEVFMSRWMLGVAAATLICAGSSAALANQAGAVTGGVAGAVGGAVVGGPVGAVVGFVGGAAIGNAVTGHHHYYHHHYAYYHHHYYYHPY